MKKMKSAVADPIRATAVATSVPTLDAEAEAETIGGHGTAPLARVSTEPITIASPYNPPEPLPVSTPRTTHLTMLTHELSDSLRRNFLWERQVNHGRSGGGTNPLSFMRANEDSSTANGDSGTASFGENVSGTDKVAASGKIIRATRVVEEHEDEETYWSSLDTNILNPAFTETNLQISTWVLFHLQPWKLTMTASARVCFLNPCRLSIVINRKFCS